ncbi:MAG: hypothetical protein ACI4QR_02750 [Eubacteriales bacterium]
MKDNLFRKKSVDRMSSPEQLNDYIKVTNPGVWMVLAAIAVLLIGVCIWGVFGHIETKLDVAAVSENGDVICYVREDDIKLIKENMNVHIGDGNYTVSSISTGPVSVTENMNDYAVHIGGLKIGEWVYIVSLDCELPDGVYKAQIVVDSVSPSFFAYN